MSKDEGLQPEAKCPRCGSYKFQVEGLVGYSQDYDGKIDEWSSSEIIWDLDYPESAKCNECGYDVKRLLKRTGVLAQYYKIVIAR